MNPSENQTIDFDPAINLARQTLYRFAALPFVDPKVGAWNDLQSLRDAPVLLDAAALLRSLPEASPAKLGLGELPLADLDPRRVLERLPDSQPALNVEYENTFGLLVSSECPPYETEYIGSKFDFQRSNGLADISGFYRAFGLTIADGHPERPDHLVLELEFMASLLGLERRAHDDSNLRLQRLSICRDAQSRFLREHLAWWVPAFAKLLNAGNANGFYAAAGNFLAALIPAERGLLGLPPVSRGAAPSTVEQPELCEGCQLAG